MILVTGPTGSGKTVTLYSALHYLNSPEKNISTVEDPVEIPLEGVNQVHVNPKTGLTFATALRSFCVKIQTLLWSVKFVTSKQPKLVSKHLKLGTWFYHITYQQCA